MGIEMVTTNPLTYEYPQIAHFFVQTKDTIPKFKKNITDKPTTIN